MRHGACLPCTLHGKVPVKKKGWKAGAGPPGAGSGCRGTAWPGEQSPRLGAAGTPGLAQAEVMGGTGGGWAAASRAGRVSLLHDVGVQMLSAWAADGQGLLSLWEAEEMEALSLWDSAKLPGMLSSV